MVEPYASQSGKSGRTSTAIGVPVPALLVSSRAMEVVLVALATAIVLVPVVVYPLPPLADYPNHLARMHVIASIGSDPDLARYYDIHWQIIPNLIMDFVVPPFARLVDIYHAGQAFTVICVLLVASGIFALNRSLFGGW